MDDIRWEIHDVFIAAQTPPHGVLVETVEKTVAVLRIDAMLSAYLLHNFRTDSVADLTFDQMRTVFQYVNLCAKLLDAGGDPAEIPGVTKLPLGAKRKRKK